MKYFFTLLLFQTYLAFNAQIIYTKIPLDLQLIARDKETNLGLVTIEGTVDLSTGYNFIKIETTLIKQYKILIATINSYSVLNFDAAIFNIDIDCIDEGNKEELVNLINDSILANNIYINFTRPSTVDGWVENVRDASKKIKKNSPVLVVMNHDHPFIDYTEKILNRIILEIFENNIDNK